MKLIIAGGREFKAYYKVIGALRGIITTYDVTEVVSGCARGADSLGIKAASHLGFRDSQIKKFPADWDNHPNNSAGVIRNEEMAEYVGRDGGLLVFWDGVSTGTEDMISRIRFRRLPVFMNRYIARSKGLW